MNKKKRIAVAYLVSFLINGVFWLVYARELRQAAASPPKPAPAASSFKPLVPGPVQTPAAPAAPRGPAARHALCGRRERDEGR